jgi:hypothetical protein
MNDNKSANDDVGEYIQMRMNKSLAVIQALEKKLQEERERYDGYNDTRRRIFRDEQRQERSDVTCHDRHMLELPNF